MNHLNIIVNHNNNSIEVDIVHANSRLILKGETIPCDRPSNVIRILHEVFNKLFPEGMDEGSIELTEINEDKIRSAGEW